MPTKRTYNEYGDRCAAAHALDLVGDRWSLIIVRELTLGPKRFNELLETLRGISPAVLSARLRELESYGVLQISDQPGGVRAYALTDWGGDLEPILQALGRWAQHSPQLPADGGMTPDAIILAMRTMAPATGPGQPVRIRLHLYDVRSRHAAPVDYALTFDTSGLDVGRGTLDHADADVAGDSTAWAAFVFGDTDLPSAEAKRELEITGDRDAVLAVAAAFLTASPPGDLGS